MAQNPRFELGSRLGGQMDLPAAATPPRADQALKNFRYVVSAVNDDALAAWADLWKQLQPCVTLGNMVLPQAEQGFKPACGWAEFLEKFWLLKHYLDYIHRFCRETPA